jgi:hypothetical protein
MTRVFISYSYDRDREFVVALHDVLGQLDGIEVLNPTRSVTSRSEMASEIRAQIEQCDVALAIVGPDRPNILLETGIAMGADKDLLLVAESVDALPFSLRSLPIVLRSGDPEFDCAKVVRMLLSIRPSKIESEVKYDSALKKLESYRSDRRFFDSISPVVFEELIAEVFMDQGFKVTFASQAADAGFDIFLESPHDQKPIAVQVKKYSKQSRVSIGHVRELLGAAVLNNVDAAVLVTSSSFTAGAEAMAAQSTVPKLVLVTMDRVLDGEDIGSMLKSAANRALQADRPSVGG